MKKPLLWPIAIVVVAAIAVAAYFGWKAMTQPPPPAPPVQAPAAKPVQETAPPIHYVLQPPEVPTPLPELNESDKVFTTALEKLLGSKFVRAHLHPETMIRRVVATVDNLPRSQVATRVMPMRPVEGEFAVAGQGSELKIDPANAARYAAYIAALRAVDVHQLADLYVEYYPLFQRAYEELGYPGAYFNDRLIEALDDALAAPDPAAPVALAQPKVFYTYADPELEARSAGQKIMMRMGSANEKQTKAVLRAIRDEITHRAVAKQ